MRVLASVLVLLLAGFAHAEDSAISDSTTSTTKLPSEVTSQRKDIDEEITNAKLRASTGSKSVWSVQSEFDYSGGSIDSPFAATRPKLTPGTVGNDPITKLDGQISAKYRLGDHDNLNLGAGVGWSIPGREGQHGQVENPYLAYTRLFKAGPFQNVISLNGTYFTAQHSVNVDKLVAEGDVSWQILYTIGHTKLQVGLALDYSRQVYSETMNEAVSDQIDADPYAEYALTDMFTIRTVYNGGNFTNTVASPTTYTRDFPAESLGLGISLTRDIYLYPNVQWVWSTVSADKTNVALNAYINL